MVELGVALTWIVISAAGAKGLSLFARAAATNRVEEEMAVLAGNLGESAGELLIRPFGGKRPPVLAIGHRASTSASAAARAARA
ncbi:MAG TPA: hypothetical protein VK672_07430 [Solirubrobacteraceae bacterium]|nr:hypothetical protein [Solirubrobacteraceae bacterium]